jgi:diaminohydroxyphosphoribosylaminopyrimidine deaminase/5-amino-6-(5-phosphoribosylamino)uracil reductase
MVGAVLVKAGKLIGQGCHRRAGQPHAEVEALADARERGQNPAGSTLYVTLEPCCTIGRTPPCTEAILASGIKRLVAAATDPNPKHAGRGFEILRRAGLEVLHGIRSAEAARLNEAFNHWIVHGTPFVTLKAAMSLDGKIATASGDSRWVTGERARAFGMKLRQGADAILVGINTVLADNPRLTVRRREKETPKSLRRIVLDARARTPLQAHVLSDAHRDRTTIVVADSAPRRRVDPLRKLVTVLVAPSKAGRIDIRWLLAELGRQSVTSLLVEGGGEVNASFLLGGLVHRIAFFYAPLVLGGRNAPGAVAGSGVPLLSDAIRLSELESRWLGPDLLLTARISSPQASPVVD